MIIERVLGGNYLFCPGVGMEELSWGGLLSLFRGGGLVEVFIEHVLGGIVEFVPGGGGGGEVFIEHV